MEQETQLLNIQHSMNNCTKIRVAVGKKNSHDFKKNFEYLKDITTNNRKPKIDLPRYEYSTEVITENTVFLKLSLYNTDRMIAKYLEYYQLFNKNLFRSTNNLICYKLSNPGLTQFIFYNKHITGQLEKVLVISLSDSVRYHYVYQYNLRFILHTYEKREKVKLFYLLNGQLSKIIKIYNNQYSCSYNIINNKIREISRFMKVDDEYVTHGLSEFFDESERRVLISFFQNGMFIHCISY